MHKKLSDYFSKISEIVGAVCIIVMSIMIFVEVILRNFVHTSMLVSDEYAGYLMVFITYWGAAAAFHSGSFVRVEPLYDHFPAMVKKVLDYVYRVLFLGFNSYICFYFFRSLSRVWSYQSTASTVARTPLWIPYGICWLGILMFEIYLVVAFIEHIYFDLHRKEGTET